MSGLTSVSDADFQATSMKAEVTKDLPGERTSIMTDEHEVDRDGIFERESDVAEEDDVNDRAFMKRILLEHSYVFYTKEDRVEVVVSDDYVGDKTDGRMVGGNGLNLAQSSSVMSEAPTGRHNRDHVSDSEPLHKAVYEVDSRDDFDGTADATAHSFVGDADKQVLVADGQNVFVIDDLDAGSGTAERRCEKVSGNDRWITNQNNFGSYLPAENGVAGVQHAGHNRAFSNANFAASASNQGPSASGQQFFNSGQQCQHYTSMGFNLDPTSPGFNMCGTGGGSSSVSVSPSIPSATFCPNAAATPYPVSLQSAEGMMLYGSPVSNFVNPHVPYPVPVSLGVGGAVSLLSGSFYSQPTSPLVDAGQQFLGFPSQLFAPFSVYGHSSNQAAFPLSFHSQSPSEDAFPGNIHGQSSDQHRQRLLSTDVNGQSPDQIFVLFSVDGQTVLLDTNMNVHRKPKIRRRKLIKDGENGRAPSKKAKYCRKQLADIQNVSAQVQSEFERFRAQAEVDEMINGVSGPKKPRKRGRRPKSAASKSGKSSAESSSAALSASTVQKLKGKRTSKAESASKTG